MGDTGSSDVRLDIIAGMRAADVLRTARQRQGLSQRDLAARARTSQAAVSRIERGLVSPSVDTLSSLLHAMGERLVLAGEPIPAMGTPGYFPDHARERRGDRDAAANVKAAIRLSRTATRIAAAARQ